MSDEPHDGYAGPVTVVVGETAVPADAVLRGHLEPIDGRYHWYGRLSPNPELDVMVEGATPAEIRTPTGSASGKLGDPDTWNRLRVSGVGRPPFPLEEIP